MRISELGLRVIEQLSKLGLKVSIKPDYSYKGVRNYRVSSNKIQQVLGIFPKVTIEEPVKNLVEKVTKYGYTDYENPKYYNIRWMRLLEEARDVIRITGSVFNAPSS